MRDKFNIGDLLIALSIDSEVKENKLRLFLYLYSMILAENKDDLGQDIPTENCYVTTSEIVIKKLNMTPKDYYVSKKFLLDHHVLLCQELGDKEIWAKENNNRWFLKSLGANLIDVNKIENPELVMSQYLYEKLSNKPKKL